MLYQKKGEYANDLLIDVLKMANEDDSTVQLHVEENGEETCKDHRCNKIKIRFGQRKRRFAIMRKSF